MFLGAFLGALYKRYHRNKPKTVQIVTIAGSKSAKHFFPKKLKAADSHNAGTFQAN